MNLYTDKSIKNEEDLKKFLIDICKCFRKDLNYTYYEIIQDTDEDFGLILYDTLVAKAHTKREAHWILFMFYTLTFPGFSPIYNYKLHYDGDMYINKFEKFKGEISETKNIFTELSFENEMNVVHKFKGKISETKNILVLSMDDILYFLGNCYPNPIYHIMPDIRQLNEKINEQEQQIQGLLNTIANLKHNWN